MATLKRLWLGMVLIALSSGVLLLSDWNRSTRRVPHVALLQHASQPLLDEGIQGMLDGLAAGGFQTGKNMVLERFNAENDVATGNAIAKQLGGGDYDLVLTSSTRSLQAVANANRDGKVKHVFCVVADPASAGVGIAAPTRSITPGTWWGSAVSFRSTKRSSWPGECIPG
ncbi:MAG: hypothetical protein HY238_26995 [Acidobacteria bacterium]|nr:hypothetical protein [Acidobacteriota bacterium]